MRGIDRVPAACARSGALAVKCLEVNAVVIELPVCLGSERREHREIDFRLKDAMRMQYGYSRFYATNTEVTTQINYTAIAGKMGHSRQFLARWINNVPSSPVRRTL